MADKHAHVKGGGGAGKATLASRRKLLIEKLKKLHPDLATFESIEKAKKERVNRLRKDREEKIAYLKREGLISIKERRTALRLGKQLKISKKKKKP